MKKNKNAALLKSLAGTRGLARAEVLETQGLAAWRPQSSRFENQRRAARTDGAKAGTHGGKSGRRLYGSEV